jgi:spore germination protein KB
MEAAQKRSDSAMKQKLSGVQAAAILINMIVPSAILIIPSHVIEMTRQDEWVSMLLALGLTLVFTLVIGMICRQFSGASVLDWLESRMGRLIAKLLGFSLCFYYLVMASTNVRQYANYIWEQMMMKTPLFIICLVIAAIAVYMASRGVEAMGRIHFNVFMLYISFVVINLFLLGPQYNLNQFKPAFEVPPVQHMFATAMPAGWLSSIASIVLLLPYLKKDGQAQKIALWSTLIAGLMLVLITSVAVAVFGADIIDAIAYPAFAALGTIDIGQFLERVDILLLTAWMASMFANVSVYIFFLFQMLEGTFKLNSKMATSGSLVLFITVTAVYSWPSHSAVVYFSSGVLSVFMLGSNYSVYLAIWAGLFATRRKGRERT